jgi:hypothetical protein
MLTANISNHSKGMILDFYANMRCAKGWTEYRFLPKMVEGGKKTPF